MYINCTCLQKPTHIQHKRCDICECVCVYVLLEEYYICKITCINLLLTLLDIYINTKGWFISFAVQFYKAKISNIYVWFWRCTLSRIMLNFKTLYQVIIMLVVINTLNLFKMIVYLFLIVHFLVSRSILLTD